jgi:hypothetical protein
MTIAKTKLAYSEYLKLFPYNVQEICDTLICPELETKPQLKFLSWLVEECKGGVEGLHPRAVVKAKGLIVEYERGFTYSNQDVDWCSGVRTLIWNEVPVAIWCHYRNELAYDFEKENNIELIYYDFEKENSIEFKT